MLEASEQTGCGHVEHSIDVDDMQWCVHVHCAQCVGMTENECPLDMKVVLWWCVSYIHAARGVDVYDVVDKTVSVVTHRSGSLYKAMNGLQFYCGSSLVPAGQ